jgi:autotransporter-associated beta strand protein
MDTRRSYTCLASLAIAAAALLNPHAAKADAYYWDNNDVDPGFGAAAGAWSNTASLFSTDVTGQTAVPGNVVTTTSDDLHFGTAADGLATGAITINGTVNARSLTFGAASDPITFNAGTNALINFGAADALITVDTTGTPRSNVALNGAGTLTKAGIGTLTINNNATFTGAVSVNQGTLRLGATTSSGSINSSPSVVVAAGALLEFSRTNTTTPGYAISGGGAVQMDRTGTLNLNFANTFSGGLTISAGTVATGAVAGTLGTGDVALSDDPGQTGGSLLTLNNNFGFGDAALLTFAPIGTTINLAFTGIDTLAGITNGTTAIGPGTYSADQLNTFFGGTNFTGAGLLQVAAVAVPEPASLAALTLASLPLLLRRRR